MCYCIVLENYLLDKISFYLLIIENVRNCNKLWLSVIIIKKGIYHFHFSQKEQQIIWINIFQTLEKFTKIPWIYLKITKNQQYFKSHKNKNNFPIHSFVKSKKNFLTVYKIILMIFFWFPVFWICKD